MNSYVLRLADELSRAGVQADVFTRRTDAGAPEITCSAAGSRVIHLTAGPVSQIPKGVLPLHIPAMAAALRDFADRQRIRYDILHSHYWLSGLVALRFRRCGTPPLVHMFHTLALVKEAYVGHPDASDSALRADGERCILECADAVVGARAAERQEMERFYGRSPDSYAVIPPGVDTQRFRPLDKEVSRRALGVNAEKVVLFVGRLEEIKGLHVLIRAVAELIRSSSHSLKLLVVGGEQPAGDSRSNRYRQMVARLGLESVVEFRGVVPQRELPEYYTAADICALPSSYESFGMAALESMSCQTPVVAFRAGGYAETIRDGETGFLVEGGSQEAYLRALRVALDTDRLETMGRRARLSVQRYSWKLTGKRTLDLYERLLQRETCMYHRASGG